MSNTTSSAPPSQAMFESLERAFTDFQVRAEKLSRAYEQMQGDFKKVNLELDRKNAELNESLAKQAEMQTYLGSILQSMNNGVIGIDTKGRITQFNRAAEHITGFGSPEALGARYAELFFREKDEETGLLHVLRSGKGHQRDEKVIWHKDGFPAPVSFQSALLKDHQGEVIGAVEIFNDISKIKALEEEMQQSKTMALIGEMAATVAHEIRNPLGAMGVWAGLLDRDFDRDDSRRQTLKKIIDGLGRLNRIVSNLLVYSRPVQARMRTVRLQDILNETVGFTEIEIARLERPVVVARRWNENYRQMVLGDPEKLEQVIMNLCLNAIQAMPDGGQLRVSLDAAPKERSGFACFTISDTGSGIDKEHRERIFDPFYTTRENGTGLGLAIVKKFIDHHSGIIDIKSNKGKGTSVSVYLPKIEKQESVQ
jgi:PAS domain S-box-containing protein